MTTAPPFVVITIWEHVEPMVRGDRYEDPLDEALEDRGEVVGGGSQFTPETGIEYVNIEVELESLDSIPLVISTLERRGVPKGSELRYTKDGSEVVEEFGVAECLGLFIDGVGLPEAVYEESDINQIADDIMEALDGTGFIRASFMGATETSILIFGRDAEAMYSKLEKLLSEVLLLQNSRIVIRHGKSSLKPREFRLPFHKSEP